MRNLKTQLEGAEDDKAWLCVCDLYCDDALATLDLAAPAIGRTATWIIQPILLIAGGLITASQVFTVRFVEAAFRKSQDADARAVDVRRLIDAASAALPTWLRPMVVTRFVLVTLGSALVLLLLAIN